MMSPYQKIEMNINWKKILFYRILLWRHPSLTWKKVFSSKTHDHSHVLMRRVVSDSECMLSLLLVSFCCLEVSWGGLGFYVFVLKCVCVCRSLINAGQIENGRWRERTRTVSAAIIFSEERLTAALFPRHGWSIDTRSVSNNNSAARLNREETESPADGSPQINHVSHLGSQECLIVFKLAKSEIWTQIFLVKWSELLYTFILQLYTHTVQINFVCLYFSCCI